jgi:outer membrane protein
MNLFSRYLIASTTCFFTLLPAAQAENLMDVYQLALTNDAQYQAAKYAYESVQASEPLARSSLLPQLNASAQVFENRNETDADNPLFDGTDQFRNSGWGLNLTQSIYRHDNWMNLRQAQASVAQAEAEYKAALQDLIVRTSEAYFNVLSAEDNLEFATAEKEAIGRQLEQSQKRFEVGLIAITDVKESQASYDSAVAEEINALNQLDIAREALAVLTGQYIENLDILSDDLPLVTPTPDDIQAWVDQALEQNLTFLAAQMAAKASDYGVKSARAGHYPYLDLVANYEQSELDYQDSGTFTASNQDSTDSNIGLQLTIPIFQGLRVNSQTEQAAAQYNQSLQNMELARRQTIQQTRSSFLSVKSGISQVQAFSQALESTRTSAEATQAGFQVGTRTAVDVLLTLRTVFDADRNYSRARYDYILNYLRLRQAAGTLTENEVDIVNALLIKKP